MRQEINDTQLEQVVGGTVKFSGSVMKIKFTVIGEQFDVKNCEDWQAMALISQLYGQYKAEGNRVFETKTKEAFQANGWI